MPAASRSPAREETLLSNLVVAVGLGWSLVFVIVALVYELQLYADGAIFSYAVAVQDVWAIHWHNVANRASVFLLSLWPAEILVGLTGSPAAGIITYGFLFYVAPLIGLVGTLAADRSRCRIFFAYACASTALLCPLIFGFPTEMWMAHALFWPTLALAHYARPGVRGAAALSIAIVALVLAHEGGVVLAFVVVATLALHGLRHPLVLRGATVLFGAMALWIIVKMLYPPDDYFADVLVRAGLHFFDPAIFQVNLVVLLIVVLAGYGLLFLALSRIMAVETALLAALAGSAIALLIYWLQFDHWVHAGNRYYLRTALVVLTPAFGVLSTVYAMRADGVPVDSPRLLQIAKFLDSVQSGSEGARIGQRLRSRARRPPLRLIATDFTAAQSTRLVLDGRVPVDHRVGFQTCANRCRSRRKLFLAVLRYRDGKREGYTLSPHAGARSCQNLLLPAPLTRQVRHHRG